ncbi:MAG: two-component system response regulator AtoC [Parasphingorhabdus sp.]|jgi:two-component system response regulator AtoC
MPLASQKPTIQQLVDLVSEPFVIINKNYQIVAANKQYCDHYATTTRTIAGKCCHEVSHHSAVPCHQNGEHCPLVEVFRNRHATSVVHVHYDKNGCEERVLLNATPLLDEQGRVAFMAEKIVPLDGDLQETANETMVGRSGAMLRLLSILQRVAPTQTTVLLEGESGVGKECAAKYIHQYSTKHLGPLVVVDCTNLGEESPEQELFGVETGAGEVRLGLLESADRGTIYMDDVCELSMALQTRLLRFIETSSFRRVGGSEYQSIDVRLIASTTRSLAQMVENGEFRRDLYYRLSAFPIGIPPLRNSVDDVPQLAEALLAKIENGNAQLPLTIKVIEALMGYDFPGNVRELRNILERATILAGEDTIRPKHLRFEGLSVNETAAPAPRSDLDLQALTAKEERVLTALKNNQGNRSKAARSLGMSERTIYRHVRLLRERLGNQVLELD